MTTATSALPLPRFVKTAQACELLGGIKRSTLNELVERGVLPPPLVLSRRLRLFEYGAIVEAVRKRARNT